MENFGVTCKEGIIAVYAKKFKDSGAVFVTRLQGVSSPEVEGLRRTIKEDGASDFMILKNSLAKRALKESGIENGIERMESYFVGSCAVAFSKADPVAVAKALMDFAKSHELVKVQGGLLDGEPVETEAIKVLSELPSRDTLIAMVVGTIKAPITGFVNVLGGTLRSLLYAVNAIKDKKSQG